jgi:GH15 family glucan-1,4-alpha-glucosidase
LDARARQAWFGPTADLTDFDQSTVRRKVRRASLVLLILTLVSGFIFGRGFWVQSHPQLYGMTLGILHDGTVTQVSLPVEFIGGSRVVVGRGSSSEQLAAHQRHWLRSGSVPVITELNRSSMVEDALLDLNTLSLTHGVPVTGWEPAWRYVWPRDSALVASALARSQHSKDARAILDFLETVQPSTGIFQARYLPDGSGPPDGRGVQLDGTGWALWALRQVVVQEKTDSDRRVVIERYSKLLRRSSEALLALTANGSRLPPVSADYWETKETKVTLETCAAILMGLRSSQAMYSLLKSPHEGVLEDAADNFQHLVLEAFAPDGFPRHLGGSRKTVDLGVAFLLPPFGNVTDTRVLTSWRNSTRYLARPAGGLAPGGSWRSDGISWTVPTSIYAIVEACQGMRPEAVSRLQWLDDHRTPLGSLPEKVLASGSAASVAPLGWTAGAVISAVDVLQHGCR